MSKYMVDSSDLTSVADAIRSKAETDAPLEFPDEFVNAVNNLSVMKDYDSEFVFELTAATLTVNLYLTQSVANAVTINWGDGSATETSPDLSAEFTHTYASADNYAVKVICKDGEVWCPGGTFNSKTYCLLGDASGSYSYSTLISAMFGKNTNLNNLKCMAYCKNVRWTRISKHITTIGNDAFMGYLQKDCCIDDLNAWSNITLGNYNSIPFYGGSLYLNGEMLVNLTISDPITHISNSAFRTCRSLRNVVINSADIIEPFAFSACLNIQNLVIRSGLTRIEDSTFNYNYALSNVTLPGTVTYIGSYGFDACTSLMSLTCYAVTPPELTSTTFNDVPSNCNIYVPAQSVEAYKQAQYWSDRADYIQAIPS